jgi:hypothetical protein
MGKAGVGRRGTENMRFCDPFDAMGKDQEAVFERELKTALPNQFNAV